MRFYITKQYHLKRWLKDFVQINEKQLVYLTPLVMSSSIRHSNKVETISSERFYNQSIIILYRDPIDRFLSFYNKKILANNTLRKRVSNYLTPGLKAKSSIDELIIYLKETNPLQMEKHLRPIYYTSTAIKPSKIEYLNPFIRSDKNRLSRLGIKINSQQRSSISLIDFPIKREDLTKHQVEMIKEIYSKDYEIINTL